MMGSRDELKGIEFEWCLTSQCSTHRSFSFDGFAHSNGLRMHVTLLLQDTIVHLVFLKKTF